MDIIYLDNYAYKVEQDKGHDGILHDDTGEKHYGMFVFKFVAPQDFLHFKLRLNVELFEQNFSERTHIGTIIPGTFMYPTYIWANDFLTDYDLNICGWEPVKLQLSSTLSKSVEYKVYSDMFISGKLDIEFHFNFNSEYLGFLFVPEITDTFEKPLEHFRLKFYDTSAVQSKKPVLKCQPSVLYKTVNDTLDGVDKTESMIPNKFRNKDFGYDHEIANPLVFMDAKSDGVHSEEASRGVKIKSVDPAHNFSLAIQHIALKENGEITEIYGFNGYTARTYYENKIRGRDFVYIKKCNYMTWSGLLVEWPWCSMLWYGEVIYFADQDEFGQCCREYFAEHGMDACPICGEPLGHFKVSFIDITRKPHQLYFCSLDCYHAFEKRLMYYLEILTKDNIKYLIDD